MASFCKNMNFNFCRSIGLFGHQELPGEMRLVHGQTLDLQNLANPEITEFVIHVTERTMTSEKGGHVDLFAPFGSCGERNLSLLHPIEPVWRNGRAYDSRFRENPGSILAWANCFFSKWNSSFGSADSFPCLKEKPVGPSEFRTPDLSSTSPTLCLCATLARRR